MKNTSLIFFQILLFIQSGTKTPEITIRKLYQFLIKLNHQYDKEQNKQHLFMSDLEFKPIHKHFRVTISFYKFMKDSNSDMISLHIYNNSPDKTTLAQGLSGYCETNKTISPTKGIAYRVNKILQLFYTCQSTIFDEELSLNNILSNTQITQKEFEQLAGVLLKYAIVYATSKFDVRK